MQLVETEAFTVKYTKELLEKLITQDAMNLGLITEYQKISIVSAQFDPDKMDIELDLALHEEVIN